MEGVYSGPERPSATQQSATQQSCRPWIRETRRSTRRGDPRCEASASETRLQIHRAANERVQRLLQLVERRFFLRLQACVVFGDGVYCPQTRRLETPLDDPGARYDRCVAETDGKPLAERLEEMRAQLAWVRDYL
jgi:hypothetical protein